MIFKLLSVLFLIALGQLDAQQCFENDIQREVTSQMLTSRGPWYIWINNDHNGNCTQFIFTPLNNSNNVLATLRLINKTSGEVWSDTLFMEYNSRGSYTLYLTNNPQFNAKQPGNVADYGNATFIELIDHSGTNRVSYILVVCPGTAPPFYYIVTNFNPVSSSQLRYLKEDLLRKTGINADNGFAVPLRANNCSAYNNQ
ncbi:hypothetical protein CHUAL_008170 [Chamberlinius hualienensis]